MAVESLTSSAPATIENPLRNATFRDLWLANIVSNIGTWMQTVGGAWLMTTLTADALPVALMQTATSLPAFLVGLPAGSLADRLDRRRLLLVTQAWMLLCAAVLGVVTLVGGATPWLLLGMTFALGLGGALAAPAWSAIIPDVVERPQVPTAISMNSAGYNVARATGPAIGGVVVGGVGPAYAFLVNAVSFLATLAVVARWRPRSERPGGPSGERLVTMVVAGLQYVWQAEAQRVVLVRSMLWMLCASALWGLLPVVARRELALDAAGYGVLVTCVGAGAVGGAFALPLLRRRIPTNRLLMLSIVIFTIMFLVLAWVRLVPVVCATLAIGGAAWTTSNQNFQIAVQMSAHRRMTARANRRVSAHFSGRPGDWLRALGSALRSRRGSDHAHPRGGRHQRRVAGRHAVGGAGSWTNSELETWTIYPLLWELLLATAYGTRYLRSGALEPCRRRFRFF
ncbi:MAG: MFS transporter [Chloroflexi bacterium]|nr:MFS transporter [Chloroflexota bacterium]